MNDKIRQLEELNHGTKAMCGKLKDDIAKTLERSEGMSFTRSGMGRRSRSPGNGRREVGGRKGREG